VKHVSSKTKVTLSCIHYSVCV